MLLKLPKCFLDIFLITTVFFKMPLHEQALRLGKFLGVEDKKIKSEGTTLVLIS